MPLKPEAEQILVENNPFKPSILSWLKLKKVLPDYDLTTIGALENWESIQLLEESKKYREFLNVYKKVINMGDKETLSNLINLIERLSELITKNDKQLITDTELEIRESEKIALYRVLREPYNFLKELETLFNISMILKKDILELLGIKARISPLATAYTLNTQEILPKPYYTLLFFTNHSWHNKKSPQAIALAIINFSKFQDPNYYTQELIGFPQVFWDKLKTAITINPLLWKERLFYMAIGIIKPNPFDPYLTAQSNLSVPKNQMKKILSIAKQGNWKTGAQLLRKLENILNN
jgi:hypothetical protein